MNILGEVRSLSEDKLIELSKDIEEIKRRLGIVESRLNYIQSELFKTQLRSKSRRNEPIKIDSKTQKEIAVT